MATRPGFYLSVTNTNEPLIPIIMHFPDATSIDEARMDAEIPAMEAFVLAGYEDGETVYATLYQIAPNGGLAHSECYPISGPEATA